MNFAGFTDYTLTVNRLDSFCHVWCECYLVSRKDLSEAGLYYVGPGDRVRCAFCNIQLQNWREDDVPHLRHVKNNPRCPFMIQLELSLESQQLDSMNLELLEKGLLEDLNWQRYVRNSDAVKIVKEMGYGYDIIMNAVDKIGASSDKDLDFDVNLLLDYVHKLEDQGVPCTDKDPDAIEEIQHQKSEVKPATMEDIVKEAIRGILCVGSKITKDLLLRTVAIITYQQNFLVVKDTDKDSQIQKVTLENCKLKNQLDDSLTEKRCKVCWNRDKNALILPCRHLCCCVNCANRVHKCPVCRGEIQTRIEVYMS